LGTETTKELEMMGATVLFKPTAIQRKAPALLKGGAKHVLLFGGSRSGKTAIWVMVVIYRAFRASFRLFRNPVDFILPLGRDKGRILEYS
jgi:hypothetical protein